MKGAMKIWIAYCSKDRYADDGVYVLVQAQSKNEANTKLENTYDYEMIHTISLVSDEIQYEYLTEQGREFVEDMGGVLELGSTRIDDENDLVSAGLYDGDYIIGNTTYEVQIKAFTSAFEKPKWYTRNYCNGVDSKYWKALKKRSKNRSGDVLDEYRLVDKDGNVVDECDIWR
mgnify:CR=1 FL=1